MKDFRKFSEKICDRRGFALTEMVLAVIVLSMMLVVLWNAYGRIKDNNAISAAKQYLVTAVGQVQAIYNSSTDATTSNGKYNGIDDNTNGLNGQNGVKLGIWPREYLHGSSLQNGWNGGIKIDNGHGKVSGVTDDTFAITFANVSKKACTELATFGTEWAAVAVTAATKATKTATMSTATIGEQGGDSKPIPVTAKNALNACTGDYNTITWYSY